MAVFNRGDVAAIDRMFSSAALVHFGDWFLRPSRAGVPGLRQLLSTLRTAFPDLKFTLQSEIGQGRTHVYRWAARGRHLGPFIRVRATGRSVAFPGIFMVRLGDDDTIAELWVRTNLVRLVDQLGMGPRKETPGVADR